MKQSKPQWRGFKKRRIQKRAMITRKEQVRLLSTDINEVMDKVFGKPYHNRRSA